MLLHLTAISARMIGFVVMLSNRVECAFTQQDRRQKYSCLVSGHYQWHTLTAIWACCIRATDLRKVLVFSSFISITFKITFEGTAFI